MSEGMSAVWPLVGAMAHEIGVTPHESGRLVSLLRGFGLGTVQMGEPLLGEILAEEGRSATWCAHLQDAALPVAALGGYRNLVAADEATRRRNIEFLQRCLEIAPRFGTTIVATETGTRNHGSEWGPSPENQGREAWETLCASLGELLPVAERHGTILALEGHVNHIINTPERLARLLEQFPAQPLQVVLDPHNYLGAELLPRKDAAVRAFLRQFKDRFVVAHLKDVSREGAEVDTPPFGHGIFPQRIYLDFLRDERPDLPLILEHLPADHIPATLQQLRQMIEREPGNDLTGSRS